MLEGELIFFRDNNLIGVGLYQSEKKNKIQLINRTGRIQTITTNRIILTMNQDFISANSATSEIKIAFKSIEKEVSELVELIDLELAYDIIKDEELGIGLTDFCELFFKEKDLNQIFAVLLKYNDIENIYFQLKSDKIVPRPIKIVNQIIAQQEATQAKEEKKQLIKENALNWLYEFYKKRNEEQDCKVSKNEIPYEVNSYLEPLKRITIFGEDIDRKKQSHEIISEIKKRTKIKIKQNAVLTAFDILTTVGIYHEDENVALYKYQIPIKFDEPSKEEADRVFSNFDENLIINDTDRIDLRDVFTFSIDDKDTKDIDDALSFIEENDKYIFYIHISDVSYFIKENSILDQEALQRGMTVYLPFFKISMFPENLSENLMSLKEKQIKPALTFVIECDKDYEIIDNRIVLSTIIVDKNYSYDVIEEYFNNKNDDKIYNQIKHFENLANKNKNYRILNGAYLFYTPDLKIKIDETGKISLKHNNQKSRSSNIVREMMILSNHIASLICYRNKIPAVYNGQLPPDDDDLVENHEELSIVEIRDLLRKMKKSEINAVPQRHFTLGIDSYTQATSPIRRYHDILIHRQIKAFIQNKEYPYIQEDCQIVAATAEKAARETMSIERETKKYWILKYLLQNKKDIFSGIILREIINGYLVEIEDLGIQIPLFINAKLEIGMKINVYIENVIPRLDYVSITGSLINNEEKLK